MQVNDIDLYVKCHSFMDASHTFCQCKSVNWFPCRRDVGVNWVNTPKSLHVRNVTPCTTLASQYIANTKKLRFKFCMFVLYNAFVMAKFYFQDENSLLSHPQVSCIHLRTLLLRDDLYLTKQYLSSWVLGLHHYFLNQ